MQFIDNLAMPDDSADGLASAESNPAEPTTTGDPATTLPLGCKLPEGCHLTPLALATFNLLTRFTKLSVPEPQLAEALWLRVGCAVRTDPNAILRRVLFHGGLESALAELERAGLAERWTTTVGTPSSFGYAGPAVSLSAWVAEHMGIKPNRHTTRWVPVGTKERSARLVARHDDPAEPGFTLVVSEADLTDQDPLQRMEWHADPTARPAGEIAAYSEEQVRRSDREAGYVRPTKLLGCNVMWPVGGKWPVVPGDPAGRGRAPHDVRFGRVLPKVRDGVPRLAPTDVPAGSTVGSPAELGFVQDRWPYTATAGSPVPASAPGAPCPVCRGTLAPDEACAVCEAAWSDRSITKEYRVLADRLAATDRRAVREDTVPNAGVVAPYVEARRLEAMSAEEMARRAASKVTKGVAGNAGKPGKGTPSGKGGGRKAGKIKKRKNTKASQVG